MDLRDYAAKRRFDRTPEPAPETAPAEGSRHIFVVHKHAARALHYDLRLELDGALKSWAVPRGPSLEPNVKRLAVMVEDHPLGYRDFEGEIPEKSYGAGSVIIWDRGRYHHPAARDGSEDERLLRDGLAKGDLKFVLEGEKLRGEFALVRMGREGRSWLLIKKRDQYATGASVLAENRSVVSRKTLEEMFGDGTSQTFRRRRSDQIRLREAIESGALRDAPEAPLPTDVRPMLAGTVVTPFDHPDWVFEVKWDGYRAIAEARGGRVSLHSRNGISFTRRFGAVTEALGRLGEDAVLDGEIVIVDQEGRPDFEALQHYQGPGNGRLVYYVFDLLHLAGRDLTGLPLLRRKELLKRALPADPGLRLSEHISRDGVLFFRAAEQQGLEGIVAKDGRSVYEPGRRSRSWLKIKTHRTQDAVIAGFTMPGGSRASFGALVLGVYEGEHLVYIGHAGSGFAGKDLAEIGARLDGLATGRCPFPSEPETNAPVVWVRPELVCEVQFSGWTGEGLLRQPVFLRLREDRAARDVAREDAGAKPPA